MFDIGWSEMALVALLALIVIGPKDLPRVMRTASHWVRKARALGREFQSGVDEMIREADLDVTLDALPAPWRSHVALVQNDLVPSDWSRHHLLSPTVAVVWFEKKPGRAVKVIRPTLIGGQLPH